MHLLVGIQGKPAEWQAAGEREKHRPRLPFPYAFSAAFVARGHRVSAVDFSGALHTPIASAPFERLYPAGALAEAVGAVDIASLWAMHGIRAAWRETHAMRRSRKVVINSYVWATRPLPGARKKMLGLATQAGGWLCRGMLFMTNEQVEMARRALGDSVPLLRWRVGIDTGFYRVPAAAASVPAQCRDAVDRLFARPYIVMPGDEQRFNDDAVDVVKATGLHLARISQYSAPGAMDRLRERARAAGVADRIFVFEKIDHAFFRFLMQGARVYAGLVDSTWQPAGWTVACEAIATGLPSVVYEGLVSRELTAVGADESVARVVASRDVAAFAAAIQQAVDEADAPAALRRRQAFAERHLDMEANSADLVDQFEALAARSTSR